MKFVIFVVMGLVSIPLAVAQYASLFFTGSTPIATALFVGVITFFHYRKLPNRQQWGTLIWLNGTLWFLLPVVGLLHLALQDSTLESFFYGWGSWFVQLVWQGTLGAVYIAIGKYLCSGRKSSQLQ